MNEGCVDDGQRSGRIDVDILIWIQLRCHVQSQLQGLLRHDTVVRLTTLAALFLFLLPVFESLLLLFQSLGIGSLCQQVIGFGMFSEYACAVGHQECDLHTQRILVDERCVAKPIGDGIGLVTACCALRMPCLIDNESIGFVEVNALDDGQLLMT